MKPLVPVFIVVALAFPLFAGADVVFQNSFESPSVKTRTPKAAGGDISKADPAHPEEKPFWLSFGDQPNIGATGGSIIAGVTNEVARTGNQSLFIEASKLSAPYIGASFSTRPLPIAGGKYYKISLWGRNDAKKPLIRAAAQLFLKMQIDFFTDEGKTETGDTQYLLQPLPGGKGYASTFVPTSWQPVGLHFGAPPKAKFMVLSFRCDSSAEKGAITGCIYFDDLTLETDLPNAADALLEQLKKEAEADYPEDKPAPTGDDSKEKDNSMDSSNETEDPPSSDDTNVNTLPRPIPKPQAAPSPAGKVFSFPAKP